MQCFNYFRGEYIIHVGETIHTGTFNGSAQCPWGRTTSSDFQVALSSKFHCLLQARIPSFPFSNDHISVWKRTRVVRDEDDEEEDTLKLIGDRCSEEDCWRDIPLDERLPDVAAPCLQHLLSS